jgi:hypothetical protein
MALVTAAAAAQMWSDYETTLFQRDATLRIYAGNGAWGDGINGHLRLEQHDDHGKIRLLFVSGDGKVHANHVVQPHVGVKDCSRTSAVMFTASTAWSPAQQSFAAEVAEEMQFFVADFDTAATKDDFKRRLANSTRSMERLFSGLALTDASEVKGGDGGGESKSQGKAPALTLGGSTTSPAKATAKGGMSFGGGGGGGAAAKKPAATFGAKTGAGAKPGGFTFGGGGGAKKPASSGFGGGVSFGAKKDPAAVKAAFRAKLIAFYEKHNPEKAKNEELLEKVLTKYTGKEKELFDSLSEKYGANKGKGGVLPKADKPTFTLAADGNMVAAKPKGTWKCDICSVNSPDDKPKCVACGTPNPKAAAGAAKAKANTNAAAAAAFGTKPAGGAAAPGAFGAKKAGAAKGAAAFSFGKKADAGGAKPAAFGAKPAAFGAKPAAFGAKPAAASPTTPVAKKESGGFKTGFGSGSKTSTFGAKAAGGAGGSSSDGGSGGGANDGGGDVETRAMAAARAEEAAAKKPANATAKARMLHLYEVYKPEKKPDDAKAMTVLKKYGGKESELFQRLEGLYIPEQPSVTVYGAGPFAADPSWVCPSCEATRVNGKKITECDCMSSPPDISVFCPACNVKVDKDTAGKHDACPRCSLSLRGGLALVPTRTSKEWKAQWVPQFQNDGKVVAPAAASAKASPAVKKQSPAKASPAAKAAVVKRGANGNPMDASSGFGAKPASGASSFGAKPTGVSGFGAKPAAGSGFGAKPLGATSKFGASAKAASPFAAKPAGSAFGAGVAKPASKMNFGGGGSGAKPSFSFGGKKTGVKLNVPSGNSLGSSPSQGNAVEEEQLPDMGVEEGSVSYNRGGPTIEEVPDPTPEEEAAAAEAAAAAAAAALAAAAAAAKPTSSFAFTPKGAAAKGGAFGAKPAGSPAAFSPAAKSTFGAAKSTFGAAKSTFGAAKSTFGAAKPAAKATAGNNGNGAAFSFGGAKAAPAKSSGGNAFDKTSGNAFGAKPAAAAGFGGFGKASFGAPASAKVGTQAPASSAHTPAPSSAQPGSAAASGFAFGQSKATLGGGSAGAGAAAKPAGAGGFKFSNAGGVGGAFGGAAKAKSPPNNPFAKKAGAASGGFGGLAKKANGFGALGGANKSGGNLFSKAKSPGFGGAKPANSFGGSSFTTRQ